MSNNTQVKTILILAANPASTSRLRLDEEVRSIEEGLQRASKGGEFRLVQKWAVRLRDFYRAILEHKPQIVHFCGHSAGVDGIVLEDDTGQATLVDKEALSKLFKLFAVKGVECVVLNACYSQVQAEGISQYIKYVIGMNQAIADKAAITFAVAFYDALGAGETVEFAFELGCTQLVKSKEDQIPVLKITSIHPADIQFSAGDIPPNPYVGLSAFGEKDATFFFGRDKFINELFEMTHHQQLVAVIGASGSGKSSIVFAGLIPRLREEGIWLIESFRPKSEPFDELALALVRQLEPNLDGVEKAIKVGKLALSLKKGEVKLHQVGSQILENKFNKRFLLVVDQFEELYTECQDKKEQQCFIDTLLIAVLQKSITLVFTLRADFYGYVLSYRPFGNALNEFMHKPLTLMNREELKAAIEQPSQKLNVELQIHLAERILDDVGNEPGNLPLLEFALTQLWNKQKDGELTHKAYDDIGGVKQALVKHAEQVYSRLSNSQQQQAQRVFLTLVRLGEATEDTRRVATQNDIGKENWELVTYLSGDKARLVVTGRNENSSEKIVEVVHEALIREWKRLRDWIDNNRAKLIQYRQIEARAAEWRDKGKLKDYLLRGKQLNEVKTLQKQQVALFTLSDLASEFIQKSIKYKGNNRLSIISFGLLSLLILLSIAKQITLRRPWSTIDAAQGQYESPSRINALQKLVELHEPLNNILLQKANLQRANLQGANLREANLQYDNLQGANLFRANLDFVNLQYANLQHANLQEANLQYANLQGANLQGRDTNLDFVNLQHAKLQHAKLQGVYLRYANLQDTNFQAANLQRASIEDVKNNQEDEIEIDQNNNTHTSKYIEEINFTDANLQDAILQSQSPLDTNNLQSANFLRANLQGAYLRNVNLIDANFWDAKLQNAKLEGANLQGATLQGANLQGAKLQGANLQGANLQGADLQGAYFNKFGFGCIKMNALTISCTNYKQIKRANNLTPQQVKQAKNWQMAIYDPEFRKKLGLPPEPLRKINGSNLKGKRQSQ